MPGGLIRGALLAALAVGAGPAAAQKSFPGGRSDNPLCVFDGAMADFHRVGANTFTLLGHLVLARNAPNPATGDGNVYGYDHQNQRFWQPLADGRLLIYGINKAPEDPALIRTPALYEVVGEGPRGLMYESFDNGDTTRLIFINRPDCGALF